MRFLNKPCQIMVLVSKFVPRPNQITSDYWYATNNFKIECDTNLKNIFHNSVFHFAVHSQTKINISVSVAFGEKIEEKDEDVVSKDYVDPYIKMMKEIEEKKNLQIIIDRI